MMFSYTVTNLGATPAYDLKQRAFIGMRKPPVTNYNGIEWTPLTEALFSVNKSGEASTGGTAGAIKVAL
jgi:hypothetical protein